MGQFADNNYFETLQCAHCNVSFAITADFMQRRRDDGKTFYCPSGHSNVYNGKTEAQKLKDELAREKEIREAAEARAQKAKSDLDVVSRAHGRMRQRIVNGTCPCCNRSFSNLRDHMKTQHPEFTAQTTFAAIRQAFGMTQEAVAKEAGVEAVHVSLYEREKPVASYAKTRLDHWISVSTANKD